MTLKLRGQGTLGTVVPISIYLKVNEGRTQIRTRRQTGVTPPKRGSSLPNDLDQTQSRGFG